MEAGAGHRTIEQIDADILQAIDRLSALRGERKRADRSLSARRARAVKQEELATIIATFDGGMKRKIICTKFDLGYWQLNHILNGAGRSDHALHIQALAALTPEQRSAYDKMKRRGRGSWRTWIQIAKQVHPSTTNKEKETDHGRQGGTRPQSEGLREQEWPIAGRG